MPTCPGGHWSGSEGWCEVCGLRISKPQAPAPAPPRFARPPVPPLYEPPGARPSRPAAWARQPTSPHTGQAGPGAATATDSGDYLLPPPLGRPVPAAEPNARTGGAADNWTAVVASDHQYHAAMMARSSSDATSLHFPAASTELLVPLLGNEVTIGRRRRSTGESPDIDLSLPPEDPGVSHRHAVLVRRTDGGWSVLDQDSTNGTTVNHGHEPIAPYLPVELADGDRVHVGAWTTIRLRRG